MTLHLINKSPAKSSALNECLSVLEASNNSSSAILLIEDAVYSALKHPANMALHKKIKKLASPCYLLKEDLLMRGLHAELVEGFTIVDYAGFVQLSLDFKKVQSWS
jgi:tRNA 2-thiouridine synthesizing protein B